MNNKSRIVRLYLRILPLFVLLIASSRPVFAQDPVPVDANGDSIVLTDSDAVRTDAIETQLSAFTTSELEEFVGPIALYPDNLLAIILPASTYPLQIVLAARFLDQLESNSSLEPDESWDESIVALLNYPEVVQMMNENIQWTWQLGEAVVSQEADVLTAIKSFRELAYVAGNLQSDEIQEITNTEDTIVITQLDETVVYVPYYVPEEVIVYQPLPVYNYYPTPYPVYYYPYTAGHHFIADYFWGVTNHFTIGWSDHHLHVYHQSYSHHPYNGYHYDSSYRYRRSNLGAFNRFYVDNSYRRPSNRYRDGSYWRPQRNSGSRPINRRNRNNDYSATVARADRRGNIGLNDNRRTRSDRPPTTALTNNNRRTQISRESPGRQRNRRGSDSTPGQLANALTNSTTATARTPSAVDRVRAQARTERTASDNRRRSSRTGNQVRNQNGSNTARTTSNRQGRSTVNPTRQQPAVALSTQTNRVTTRFNRERAIENRSQRVAPAETRSREVRRAPTRQRSAPRSRSREASSTNSRSSAPAVSRNTRPASRSTRSTSTPRSTRSTSAPRSTRSTSAPRSTRSTSAPRSTRSSSVSRSTPSSVRQSNQNNSRSDRGRRREP